MEKLTIKELAPYLPYGVMIRTTGLNPHSFIITKKLTPFLLSKFEDREKGIKPILRPLSDLTNDELRKAMYAKNHSSHIDWTTDERDYWIKVHGREKWINEIPYAVIQYLFKNHYDLFGLIEKGLAIDINTLEK